jgi:hypothetical protein
MTIVEHKFHYNLLPTWNCNKLILGTFNPKIGSNADYYYGRIKKTGGWSNRFWPAINSYIENNYPDLPLVKKGDLNSKLLIMKEFQFGCIDIIRSIESNEYKNITGNGFPDSAIFNSLNKVHFNTKLIIEYIENNNISMVISSFGKGTSLNKKAKAELEIIVNNSLYTKFHLFELPAFGRPLMSTECFGKELFKFIL